MHKSLTEIRLGNIVRMQEENLGSLLVYFSNWRHQARISQIRTEGHPCANARRDRSKGALLQLSFERQLMFYSASKT